MTPVQCEECGDTADCLRLFDPMDRVYVAVCIDCETEFKKNLEENFRDFCGLQPCEE